MNEISGIVYRCRLKDIGFLTLFSSFVSMLNREMGEVSGCVKNTERVSAWEGKLSSFCYYKMNII